MLRTARWAGARLVVVNCQKEVTLDLPGTRAFVGRLRRALRMGRGDFNVSFVNDREIARLNTSYLRRGRSTDVLSFRWRDAQARDGVPAGEFANFLGDVVVSAETAKRNARAEGHSIRTEVCWLILHGVLHLLGYDHETDKGEMTSVELSLRERLGCSGRPARRRKRARERK